MTSATLRRWLVWSFGTGLAMLGARRRRSVPRALLSVAGQAIALRAAAGYDDLAAVQAWLAQDARGASDIALDPISETLAESFPASDPPSWTSTTGVAFGRVRR